MEEERPDSEPDASRQSHILQRRARLLAQLECPECRCGRMPETKYCLRCGAELPEVQREESPDVAWQRRPGPRALNWFIDLVPGVVSPKVLAYSLLACVAGISGGPLALGILGMADGMHAFASVFIFPVYLLLGFISASAYVLGVTWLLYGKVCSPFEAFADFRVKHWLLLALLVVLAVKTVYWIR